MYIMQITKRYVDKLSKGDVKKQVKAIEKSKKMYKQGEYFTRPKMKSFISKESHHVKRAKKMYNIDSIKPSYELARKSGCKYNGLVQIVNKGKGAYFSSGSRPSQTAESWGIARLASALTGGKSSGIDLHILTKYCSNDSKALKLAKTFKQGSKKAPKVNVKK